jgi:hypothetical protein
VALSSALDAAGASGAKGKAGVVVEVEGPNGDGLAPPGGLDSVEGFEAAVKNGFEGLGGSTCFEVTSAISRGLLSSVDCVG